MNKISQAGLNFIFCIQVLLIFLLFVEDRIMLPPWLQVAGRMHPLILHLPIGIMSFLVILILVQKQFEQALMHQVIHLGLLLTSISASLAALFGFFLSLQSDYGSTVLMRHKVGGVILSCLCYGVLLWHYTDKKRSVFFALGAISVIALIFTGHTGAVLTHGDNFLFAPVTSKEILTVENATVYQFAVQPILERKCFSCHNESKAKGGLIMTSPTAFAAGGDNGKPWVEGDPAASRMIKSFYLPISHDEHMPPDGKPQLTQLEISTLEAWIKSGADFEKKLHQLPEGDSLKFMVASLTEVQPVTQLANKYTFEAVSEDVIEKLNTPFRTVFPLYQNSPALQADFFVKKSFEIKALEELKAIQDQLVVLNLSKMPVADKDLSIIKSFKNLEYLNLNFSSIKGDGLAELKDSKNLKSVSLSGTGIDAKSLIPVLELSQLRDLFIWSTKVTEKEADSLSRMYPEVSIINSQFRDDAIIKLSKPILENEGLVKQGEEIVLKHAMPGAVIRYSLDGTDPDTLAGIIYDRSFKLNETTVLKARACKDRWYCSDVLEMTCFVEGIKPHHAELINAADPKYPGEGALSLFDGKKGYPDLLKEPSWLGYRNQPFIAGFTFEKARRISTIVLSFGKNIGSQSFPPEEVEVWAGKNADNLSLVKKVIGNQPKGYGPLKVEAVTLRLDPADYTYFKIVAKPVSRLPEWHNGRGEKGWIFIDEIFFY